MENGGENLYAFVYNNPNHWYDYLGREPKVLNESTNESGNFKKIGAKKKKYGCGVYVFYDPNDDSTFEPKDLRPPKKRAKKTITIKYIPSSCPKGEEPKPIWRKKYMLPTIVQTNNSFIDNDPSSQFHPCSYGAETTHLGKRYRPSVTYVKFACICIDAISATTSATTTTLLGILITTNWTWALPCKTSGSSK